MRRERNEREMKRERNEGEIERRREIFEKKRITKGREEEKEKGKKFRKTKK